MGCLYIKHLWEPTEANPFHIDERPESSDLVLLLQGYMKGGLTQGVARRIF